MRDGEWIVIHKLGIAEQFMVDGKSVCIELVPAETIGYEEDAYMYLLTNGTWRRESELLPSDIRVMFQIYEPNVKCPDYSLQRDWELVATPAEELTNLLRGKSNEPKAD